MKKIHIQPVPLAFAAVFLFSGCTLAWLAPGPGWVVAVLTGVLLFLQACFSDIKQTDTLTVGDIVVAESAGSANFNITRGGDASGFVSVDFSTTAGTATAGVDYQTNSGTLTFAPGETLQVVSVTINNDTAGEGDELFYLNLSNVNNAVLLVNEASATITDDDYYALSGLAVSMAGDIDGDGFSDYTIGAAGDDPGALPGERYVLFGGDAVGEGGVHTLGETVLPADNAFQDLGMAGGPSAPPSLGLPPPPGTGYVLFGGEEKTLPPDLDLENLPPSQGFAISGLESGLEASLVVSPAGDVNGDGFADLVVAPSHGDGPVFVIFGGPEIGHPGGINLGNLHPNQGFLVDGGATNVVPSLVGAGDVNGDGFGDLIFVLREASQ